MTLPKEKQETLNKFVSDLQQIENVCAIVLGGSFATGMASESSDLDIGIYYSEKKPFQIADIKLSAQKYSISDNLTVTDFYEWGPWVNGGAWIETSTGKVDFLYRSLEQVGSVLEQAKNGEWQNHFEQQPPYGFISVIYLSETRNCLALFDPDSHIARLKAEVEIYPPLLKQTILRHSLWSAEFTAWHAEYFNKKSDVYCVVGCLARGVKDIVNALFAINEIYPMGDKRAVEILEKSEKRPDRFKERIENILCANKESLGDNITMFNQLWKEVVELTNGTYKPFYKLREH